MGAFELGKDIGLIIATITFAIIGIVICVKVVKGIKRRK